MSQDESNRIECTAHCTCPTCRTECLTDKCDAFAASVFERSDDVIAASFAFKAYIERRLALRRKQELEMKS